MRSRTKVTVLTVGRRCLVCEHEQIVHELEGTDAIGLPCEECHAPTERIAIMSRTTKSPAQNPHAAALGRLGGLKGGPARAAALSPQRRRAIARRAARKRWGPDE